MLLDVSIFEDAAALSLAERDRIGALFASERPVEDAIDAGRGR